MKKIVFALVILLGGCISHTEQENYEMINKIVGEMEVIDDSLSYLHYNISTYMPGNEANIQMKGKDTLYATDYIESFKKTKDSAYGRMMLRYNVLQERYNTYSDIYNRIYQQLPKDSVAKNEAIQRSFEQVQRKK